MNISTIGAACLDLIFPPRCPYCGMVTVFRGPCSCGPTRNALRLPPRPLDKAATHRDMPHVSSVYAAFYYEEPIRGAIIRMKLENQPELAKTLGGEAAALFKAAAMEQFIDCLVPVPVSAGTMKSRGYNQSALLAEVVSKIAGLPLFSDLLIKTKETPKQMSLDGQARRANLAGAYAAASLTALHGKRVLLIDDVVTTGSTLEACAATVCGAGAASCAALCVAAVRS